MFLRCLVFVFLGLTLCLQGCETAKGASPGFFKDVDNTYENVGEGWKNTKEGAKKCGQLVMNADTWMRENLW